MTVDEARWIGKRVLLSNIPAHREQDPPRALFFDPQDAEGLAEQLERMWRDFPPGPDEAMEEEARCKLAGRTRAYAESFMRVVQEILNQ